MTEETRQNLLKDLLKRSPDSYGEYEERVSAILKNVKKTEIKPFLIIQNSLIMYISQKKRSGLPNPRSKKHMKRTDAKTVEVIRKALNILKLS